MQQQHITPNLPQQSHIAHIELNTNIDDSTLPYIQISNPPIKLLIDTGSMKSILNPKIAEKYYPQTIYHDPFSIKTCNGETMCRFKADIPLFTEFQTNKCTTFYLFEFHDYFDGIIGFNDIKRLGFYLDFTNNQMYNDHTTILIKYRQKVTQKPFQITIHAKEILKVEIPVDVHSGDVIILENNNFQNCRIPETLTTSKSGYAFTEIQNHTDQDQTIVISEPIKTIPFPDSTKENYHLFHIEDMFDTNPNEIKNKSDMRNLLRTEHMNNEERSKLIQLCDEFSDIFHRENEPLTFTNQVKHKILTTDEIPVHTKSYRYPFIHRQEVADQINKMLEDGIIRPSISPYSSPIWIVAKKADASGKQKWRLVVDYRKINDKTIDDRYPMPNITDILDKLGRCQYFSTLDLASGFHQIEMHPDSIPKTAFSVENGKYEFTRMPFGLKNSPSTFQRVMDDVLRDLQNKVALVYMDDVIIFSASLDEHIANLKSVFKKFREYNLKVQLDKSEFLRKEVEFLGHVITADGIKPNPKKIIAIQNFPIPKTVREIKSFLGLLGYYRRFIKDFAKITKPFTQCLKKGMKIEHNKTFVDAFNLCKNILTNDPILQYPDFEKPFNLTTDASNVAIGAILSQGPVGSDLPIAYASRTLNPAELNYSTVEKELLAIVYATKLFRPYIYGNKFKIITDHKPLQWLFSMKDPNSRLVRWRLKLEEFDYQVIFKRGRANTNADALSRIELNAIENESVIANPGEVDDDISRYLNEDIAESNVSPGQLDEYLNALTNDEDRLPDPDTNETTHSSAENPILTIPITEKSVNTYNNQIILSTNEKTTKKYVIKSKTFENKERMTVSVPFQNIRAEIINFIKEYVDPKKTHCIFLKTPNLLSTFCKVIQETFKNSSFKFVQSNTLLEDVKIQEEQEDKIRYHHETKTCHRGINETELALKRKYYWPKMRQDIERYINNCDICQTAKYDRNPAVIKFNISPTSSKPFETIHMDIFHIANQKFLTIIDTFSRYCQAYPVNSANAINIVDKLFQFISHHGIPKNIVTDGGTEFNNTTLKDFAKLHKIRLHLTTPYNSNSNSPVERVHSTLIEHIRCLREIHEQSSTEKLMLYAILAYNNSIHSVTKQTPFTIINGHTDSLDPFDTTDEVIANDYINNHSERTRALYNKIHNLNQTVKEKIINKINERREDPIEYQEDTDVYVKTNGRTKIKPKFKKTKLIKNAGIKAQLAKQTVHKKIIKRPRKLMKNQSLLQRQQNEDPPIDPNIPSCSSRN